MKSARIFQLTALLLVVVAAVQVGYWLFDQHVRSQQKLVQLQRLYAQQEAGAAALAAAGVPAPRIHALFPDLAVNGGEAVLAPARHAALLQDRARRMRQYLWEGGFFLLALCACITVIATALRAETRVLKEQEQFLALVSHQFKTPLASLQLSLETMSLRQLSPERLRALIGRMLSDLMRMEAMVGQILDSARLSQGQVDLRSEPVLLAATVTRVVGQYLERARTDRIQIDTEVPQDLKVLADPIAVDAVVRNVLENALAAVAPVGGGRVTLTARTAADEVELTVRDTGIGFRAADQAQLFRKFSRLNAGAGSSYYGTGLGLFVVKRLMQLAGGRVSARSDGLGQGAEFVLAWPAAVEPS